MKFKITSGKAFIDNSFALESLKYKKKKKTKGPSSEAGCIFLTCLLTLRSPMPHICIFLDCFNVNLFLGTCCCFEGLKLLFSIFLKQKVRQTQKVMKGSFSETGRRFLTCFFDSQTPSFSAIGYSFQNLRLSSLNCEQSFR